MSKLIFDGSAHTLTLVDDKGHAVQSWPANNVVDHKATLRFVPNGTYAIEDGMFPHTHGHAMDKHHVLEDSHNGAYGSYGIIRLCPFIVNKVVHKGVGIHAGRANQGAQNHATMGCIRTTDAAMKAISKYMTHEHLTTLTVRNNHDQHNVQPRLRGDHHAHLVTGRQGR